MSDNSTSEKTPEDSFDEMLESGETRTAAATFSISFRGYDRDEVDNVFHALNLRLAGTSALAEQLAETQARLETVERQRQALSGELKGASVDGEGNPKYQEILRIAEEEAHTIISNASTHGKRILEGAHEDAQKRIQDAQTEADLLLQQARQDSEQTRLHISGDLEAHAERMAREEAIAAEKIAQTEREAADIRAEAEKDAADLRALVEAEIAEQRARAEVGLRELLARATAVEESLARRQEVVREEIRARQEAAAAHAERITNDAKEQVEQSLSYAGQVAAKADELEQRALARAEQIDSDTKLRAREHLERARAQAHHILQIVTKHADSMVQSAEERTRELRTQEQELRSFSADVTSLIRVALPEKQENAGPGFEAEVEDELAALIARVDPTRLHESEEEHVDDQGDAEGSGQGGSMAEDTIFRNPRGADLDAHAVVDE